MQSLHKAQLLVPALRSLPSPSDAVLRLLELTLEVEKVALREIAALLRADPGLALEVLRRVEHGPRRMPVFSLEWAAKSLGVERIRELALRTELPEDAAPHDAADALRNHAIACACAAAEIASRADYAEPEAAYAAGLMRSIGPLALAALFPREWGDLRAQAAGGTVAQLLDLERAHLGIDHEQLGLLLVDAWNLPVELEDVLAFADSPSEQIELQTRRRKNMSLVSLTRAGARIAERAGFTLFAGEVASEPPTDVRKLLANLDENELVAGVRAGVERIAGCAHPRATRPEQVARTLRDWNRELGARLRQSERQLRAEESVNGVLQYGLQRLGDGDPLPGVMFHAMESMGFRRMTCLEVDLAQGTITTRLTCASSGAARVIEGTCAPFPSEHAVLGTPCILQRDDRVAEHQLVLELVGVSAAVVAPLQVVTPGKRSFLLADYGPAGAAPAEGEERCLGIIADQASLLLRYEQLTREKERLATQDPLTGAATRRRLMDRLEFLMLQTERTKFELSLVIMDLDHFKRFNDTMGHQVGDRLLQDLVDVLTAHVRRGDLVARYGGEEFIVLLPNCDLEHAFTVADGLRQRVFDYGVASAAIYSSTPVSISLGVATYVRGETATALIGRADAALYAAKHNGRNRVERAA